MARKFCKACPGLSCIKDSTKIYVGMDCYNIGGNNCQGYIWEGEEDVRKHPHEEMVRQIREVGESLIKNAESIAGYEKYCKSVYISVTVDPLEAAPDISINREFTPERFMERVDK